MDYVIETALIVVKVCHGVRLCEASEGRSENQAVRLPVLQAAMEGNNLPPAGK